MTTCSILNFYELSSCLPQFTRANSAIKSTSSSIVESNWRQNTAKTSLGQMNPSSLQSYKKKETRWAQRMLTLLNLQLRDQNYLKLRQDLIWQNFMNQSEKLYPKIEVRQFLNRILLIIPAYLSGTSLPNSKILVKACPTVSNSSSFSPASSAVFLTLFFFS